MKLLLLSDVHFCQRDFYGIPYDTRKAWMVQNLNAAYRAAPYEAILWLGDYSLDFWAWEDGGSYFHHGLSYTKRFVEEILPLLDCQQNYLIPGNHEQYSHSDWEQITGCKRQFSLVIGDTLFLMLDTFAGDLDPDRDADGTYTGADVGFIQEEMAKYPGMKTVLCAHFFDERRESQEFKTLVREEARIVCLFCGHDHVLSNTPLSGECGEKMLFHTGNYSYAGGHLANCPFGWRELEVGENTLQVRYVAPAMEWTTGNVTVACEEIRFPTVTISY